MNEFILPVKIKCDESDETLCGDCMFLNDNYNGGKTCGEFNKHLWARNYDAKRCDECLQKAVPVGANTNFDVVTESPEALANLINENARCGFCAVSAKAFCTPEIGGKSCESGILAWLKQPADESEVSKDDI
jgi:hypothetical protein